MNSSCRRGWASACLYDAALRFPSAGEIVFFYRAQYKLVLTFYSLRGNILVCVQDS
jgi:hypothetical protein